jgi:hypothetical protein
MSGVITPRKAFVPPPLKPSNGITKTAANPSSITVENGLVTDIQEGSAASGGSTGGGTVSPIAPSSEGVTVSDGTSFYDDITTIIFQGFAVTSLAEGVATVTSPSPGLQALIGTVNGTPGPSGPTGNKTFILPFITYSGYIIFADRGIWYPGASFDYTAAVNSSGQTVITATYPPTNWIAALGW